MNKFNTLDLLPSIKKAVSEKGYKSPTPIQAQAIPFLLDGRDLLGLAQTGSGKTAAFSLPIITNLARNKKRVGQKRTRVLILAPTRELASQIDANIKAYSHGLDLKTKVVFGGVGINPQIKALIKGLDFVIATPGRLLDLINGEHILLDELEVFILDEADRMLDMGFIKDIRKIVSKLPESRQTLLFSATMPKDIEGLAQSLLKDPVRVAVNPPSTISQKIDQEVCFISRDNKVSFIADLTREAGFEKGLIFARTKHGADRIVRKLSQVSVKAAAIHGNKSQNNREAALEKFSSGKIPFLVATDIAARGIDIKDISHVINFNLPEDPKSYVHRIGRTARAGKSGRAISIVDQNEVSLLKAIEKILKQVIPVNKSHPYHVELDMNFKAVKKTRPRKPSKKRKRF